MVRPRVRRCDGATVRWCDGATVLEGDAAECREPRRAGLSLCRNRILALSTPIPAPSHAAPYFRHLRTVRHSHCRTHLRTVARQTLAPEISYSAQRLSWPGWPWP
jgi:hypothetical protein